MFIEHYVCWVDPSLPSRLQRFLDYQLPAPCLLVLAGSSTGMMHDLFLHCGAPLYGRARQILHVTPMDYAAFCRARQVEPDDIESFERRPISHAFCSSCSTHRC